MVEFRSPFAGATPHLSDYDYVRQLTRSCVAWEYLRRNPDYRHDWRLFAADLPEPVTLVDGTILLHARECLPRAEAWGLCIFR